jgi:broad specificity phosphatase PhoE
VAVIYLVRHGQAGAGMGGVGAFDDGNVERSYDGLTPRGRRQAAVVARALAARLGRAGDGAGDGTVPTTVFCGPLHRQHDTAAAVASELGAGAPVTDPAWKEFDSDTVVVPWMRRHPESARRLQRIMRDIRGSDGGSVDPALAGEAESAVRGVLDGALGEWVDGPGFQEFRGTVLGGLARAADSARNSRRNGADGAVVVATSAGVIATCTAAVSGLPRQAVPALVGRVFNASVTALRVSEGAGRHGAGGAGVDLVSFNEYAHLDRPDARDDLTVI